MSVASSLTSGTPSPRARPSFLLVDGGEQRTVVIDKLAFTIGRKPSNDLVISDPRVSREHAVIVAEGNDYWIVDQSSKHGTYVNAYKVQKQKLKSNDRLEFGTREGVYLVFSPDQTSMPAAEAILSQIGDLTASSDLEKLTLLLEAVRKLNTTRVLDDVLMTLLDLTLRLTHAERAYVFLREKEGKLRMAAARDAQGRPLVDDSTISQSIIHEAATSGCEFLLTDTSRSLDFAARNSIVAFDLRTVICIPLCDTQITERANATADIGKPLAPNEIRGVLYLDSHIASREMSSISHDVLRAIAREAAALLQNAFLVQAEEAARLYQKELAIAASIQQNLMAVTIPDVPFAAVHARSIACKEIGGDFYDAIKTSSGITVVVADVAGKGVSAALLASTLQGMIYSQVSANMPLAEIAAGVNRYLCQKRLESKYATVAMVQLEAGGQMEFISCGHLPPLCVSGGKVQRLEATNLPVGLLPDAAYESARWRLQPGDRLLLYTDGVTEAENADGEFFGDDRLQAAACSHAPLESIFAAVTNFCSGAAWNDDCTVLEVRHLGPGSEGSGFASDTGKG